MKKILLALLVPLVISATAVAAPNPASAKAHCKNLHAEVTRDVRSDQRLPVRRPRSVRGGEDGAGGKEHDERSQDLQGGAGGRREGVRRRSTPRRPGTARATARAQERGKAWRLRLATAKASTAAQQKADMNAAKKCKRARRAKSNSGKAMGACVSATAKAGTVEQQKAELNAAKQCKAERAAWNSADHGGKTFNQSYGKNKNGKNAFGKCVSARAKAMHS